MYSKLQYAIYLIEYLTILCRLHYNKGNKQEVIEFTKQIYSTIENMPEEDHYGEWKANQYLSFIGFGVELNNIEIVKKLINQCHPLILKNAENLTNNIDTSIIESLTNNIESLNNKSINQFIKLISMPISDKNNDFYTLIYWVELLVTLNKTQQAKKLSSYLLKKVKNNDDIWSIYDVAPIHFKIHSHDEIEILFNQIGPNKSAYYLHAVAKESS